MEPKIIQFALNKKEDKKVHQLFEACLNSVNNTGIRIKFTAPSAVDLRKKLTFIVKNLHGLGIEVGTHECATVAFQDDDFNDSELGVQHCSVVVNPIPLGSFMSTRSPIRRIDSHPDHCLMSEWSEALGKLSFRDIVRTRTAGPVWQNGGIVKTGEPQSFESQGIEYKLFDSPTEVKVSLIEEDLMKSFTCCVHSNDSPRIVFGVLDETRTFIGLPPVDNIDEIFTTAILQWESKLFPPIPRDNITVNKFEVEGSIPTDWSDCVFSVMTADCARLAIRCLLGRCYVIEDDNASDMRYRVYADKLALDEIAIERSRASLSTPLDDGLQSQAQAQWVSSAGSAAPLYNRSVAHCCHVESILKCEWSVCDEIPECQRRVVIEVAVASTPQCRGTIYSTCRDSKDRVMVLGFDSTKSDVFEFKPLQIW